ncbi:hypothetical protein M6B38_128465 [Iris pallida]|uniref:Uncharacterized protein n=1 Tax=Iris pallida TaxID=29817 RepID=A0AAX6G4U3_IRIPA|nr:hypothetical protein M6B38_128465 [Iris pallida]
MYIFIFSFDDVVHNMDDCTYVDSLRMSSLLFYRICLRMFFVKV